MATCIWENGGVRLLPIPPGARGSAAAAINALGDIAGTLLLPFNGPPLETTQAVVWSPDGRLRRLLWPCCVQPGEFTTWSADINDHGAIAVVGTNASSRFPLVWTESEVIQLPGSGRHIVSDINNSGEGVGYNDRVAATGGLRRTKRSFGSPACGLFCNVPSPQQQMRMLLHQ
jgi:hypothetical protein